MLLEAQNTGSLPEAFSSGDISVLYKKGDTRDVRNYRPITLLQVDYKIYSKVLVKRMKTVLDAFNNHEVDYCLGGSLCRSGEEDADGLVLAGGGGEGEYEGIF
eukprot:scaffold3451_cov116-Isochrysis_galbana.AAC.3